MTDFNCYLLKLSNQMAQRFALIAKEKERSKIMYARQAELKKIRLASKDK